MTIDRLKSVTTCGWGTKAYYALATQNSWVVIRAPVLAWALVETKVNSAPTEAEEEEYAPIDPRIEETVRPVILDEGAPSWFHTETGLIHIRIPGDQSQQKDDEVAIDMAKFLAQYGQLITAHVTSTPYGETIYEHPVQEKLL